MERNFFGRFPLIARTISRGTGTSGQLKPSDLDCSDLRDVVGDFSTTTVLST